MKKTIISSLALIVLWFSTSAYAGEPSLFADASLEEAVASSIKLPQLMEASARGDADRVSYLLIKGADVNQKTKYGETAIMYAARYGRSNVVKILLKNNANPNFQIPDSGKR